MLAGAQVKMTMIQQHNRLTLLDPTPCGNTWQGYSAGTGVISGTVVMAGRGCIRPPAIGTDSLTDNDNVRDLWMFLKLGQGMEDPAE